MLRLQPLTLVLPRCSGDNNRAYTVDQGLRVCSEKTRPAETSPSVTYGVTLLACHPTTCPPEVLSKLRASYFLYISFFICVSLALTVNQRMTLNSRPSCSQLWRTGIKACTTVLDVCATGNRIQSVGFAKQEFHHLGYILLPSSCFAVVHFILSLFLR